MFGFGSKDQENTNSLFGGSTSNNNATGGGLFGNPSSTQTADGGLFGNKTQPSSGGLFGTSKVGGEDTPNNPFLTKKVSNNEEEQKDNGLSNSASFGAGGFFGSGNSNLPTNAQNSGVRKESLKRKRPDDEEEEKQSVP
jgi:hypothetical protein